MGFDPDQFKIAEERERPDILFCLARNPGGEGVFAGSSDGNIHEFHLGNDTAAVAAFEGHRSYVTGVCMVEGRLVSGGYDKRLIWWEMGSKQPVRTVKAHDKWIRAVRSSPDGSIIASTGDDMTCRIWDARTGALRHEFAGHAPETPQGFPSMLYACSFSPDGTLLATADRAGEIRVWNARSGKQIASMSAPEFYTWDAVQRIRSIGGIRSVAFSPDQKLLAVGGIGKVGNVDGLDGKARVELFDWEKGERAAEISGESKGLVQDLAFDPTGEWLIAAGGSAKGLLWFVNTRERKLVKESDGPMHTHAVSFDADLGTIIGAGHHRLVVWKAIESDPSAAATVPA